MTSELVAADPDLMSYQNRNNQTNYKDLRPRQGGTLGRHIYKSYSYVKTPATQEPLPVLLLDFISCVCLCAMDTLEYNVLRERACNAPGALLQPSVEEMQQWVTSLNRRRSLHFTAGMEPSGHYEASFRELEQRYQLEDVWGHNTTPAMQTLECIQKVKQALVEEAADDTISSSTFSVLVALSVVAAVAIVLTWPQRWKQEWMKGPLGVVRCGELVLERRPHGLVRKAVPVNASCAAGITAHEHE
ncbi:hypothetical protein VOLCADRAFT_97772 [Volvox carteri f. nagariensis]|uniref:Uncharacterized protein n=1 Tax=Volvox carteri f. nagariensis TaxID=3068 RepID=D8UDL3_VOLCA|nr:uncharacterized protein VOLCADRAFT_97772 [Volvox carteri f. nagariensis]EFJ42184.1 hypothetical protein VOLCADRAFT_97772 [Volvox carteri f. nagariensis]|eukprot:XP_002956727.1 hypothetical protein VOLCADRAFT_97772 [Volvox carteri f. nagariensis]